MKDKGFSTKEIAGELGLSQCTVNSYIKAAGMRPEKEKDMGLPEKLTMAEQRPPKIFKTEIYGWKCIDMTDVILPW